MKNDIYNQKQQINKMTQENEILVLNNLKQTQKLCLNCQANNMYEMSNSKKSTSRSIFSNNELMDKCKIKLDKNFQNLYSEDNSSKSSMRKDNFGNEIKKGGKHKIAFADEIKVAESFLKINNKNMSKNKKKKKFYSSKCLDEDLLSLKETNRRSFTPKSNRSSTIKIFTNIYKYNINKKYFEDLLVDVIKIECIKNETKLNTFFMKNRIISQEEQVCCSCYCSIW